jgi:AbrB family looped-hinge helix DNA binding protein
MLPSEAKILTSGRNVALFMNPTAKIQHRGQVTIPTRLRNQAGLSKGDVVEFSIQRGKIVITPKMAIDRSQFPNADDEYTPAQRKIIDARLAEGLADIKAGRTFGPFNSADEMIAHMKTRLKKSAAAKKSKRS